MKSAQSNRAETVIITSNEGANILGEIPADSRESPFRNLFTHETANNADARVSMPAHDSWVSPYRMNAYVMELIRKMLIMYDVTILLNPLRDSKPHNSRSRWPMRKAPTKTDAPNLM
jgi:hypothetical protein